MKENTPPKKRGRQGEGGGPKPKVITADQVRALSAMQCTQEEIASVFGLQRRHFIQRMENEPELREAWETGQGQGRMSIRRMQFDLLKGGNVTMAIWLGKQYLGQTDRLSHGGIPGQPIEVKSESAREALISRIVSLRERPVSEGTDGGLDGIPVQGTAL